MALFKLPDFLKRFARPRFAGNLRTESNSALQGVGKARDERVLGSGRYVPVGATAGALFGGSPASAAVVAAVAASVSFFIEGRISVREATRRVGFELSREALENPGFHEFLSKHKFVLIDRKLRVTGTNVAKAGVGRLRLSSEKILKNSYW